MANKQAKHLSLADRLVVLGGDCLILALNRHSVDSDQITVTIWTGPISGARQHTYSETDEVEVTSDE